jgi:hypothetical protein
MTLLLGLIFVGALVGVLKPYIPGASRSHFGIAAVVAFVLLGITAPTPTFAPPTSNAGSSPAATAPGGSADAPPAPRAKWEYSEDKDKMRGTTSRYASLRSENEVDLDFPYGTVHGTLWVRRRPEDGLSVMFAVDKGQILCNAFSNSRVSIKFDDGPVQSFRCTDSSDGSSDTAFIEGASRALSGLKNAKRTIVEAEFFQKGRQQFVFNTAGLNWK